jgi:hypothetical protein
MIDDSGALKAVLVAGISQTGSADRRGFKGIARSGGHGVWPPANRCGHQDLGSRPKGSPHGPRCPTDDPSLRHHQMASVQKSLASRPFELETEIALPILSARESDSQHSGPASAPQSQAPQKSAEAPRGAKSQSTSSISRTCKICKVVIFAPSSRIHVDGSHSALIFNWLTRVGICAIILVVCRICFVAQPGL